MVNERGKRNPEFLIFRSSVVSFQPEVKETAPGMVKMLFLNHLSVPARHAQVGGPVSSEKAEQSLLRFVRSVLSPQPVFSA